VDEIKTACDDLIEDIEEMIVAVGTTIKTEGKILSVGIYFPSGHNQVSQSRLDMYEDVGLGCWWISWKPTTQPEGIYNPGAVLQPR